MPSKALITGITGQDGSYLAELLLSKGYEVHGIVRRASTFNTGRIEHLYRDSHEPNVKLFLHYGDLTDGSALLRTLLQIQPSEIYNLAAQSHVQVSFEQPEYTAEVVATGALRLFEAARAMRDQTHIEPRIYQAGTSEMFGQSPAPQCEQTMFRPQSPYAVSKVAAHNFAHVFRDAYGLFISNGILFNHESPRRGETFVTRKITRAAGRIHCGLQKKLYLGERSTLRDWGHARDYVQAMWKMLQAPNPDDFVVATGVSHSVDEFLHTAFERVGLSVEEHVETDPRYLRPNEVWDLRGDASKAREVLGWQPTVTFEGLVAEMVDADLELAKREAVLGTRASQESQK